MRSFLIFSYQMKYNFFFDFRIGIFPYFDDVIRPLSNYEPCLAVIRPILRAKISGDCGVNKSGTVHQRLYGNFTKLPISGQDTRINKWQKNYP